MLKMNRTEAWSVIRAMQIALEPSTFSSRPQLSGAEQTNVENVGARIVEGLNAETFEDGPQTTPSPKTDREVLMEMFQRQGIKFQEEGASVLTVPAGYGRGVTQFDSSFWFNKDGSLKSVRADE